MTDLNTLASSALVSIYNDLVPVVASDEMPLSTIKKFSDKATAIKRVERILADANVIRAERGHSPLVVNAEGGLSDTGLDAQAPSDLPGFIAEGNAALAAGGEQVVLEVEKQDGTVETVTDKVPAEAPKVEAPKADSPKAEAPKVASAAGKKTDGKKTRVAAPPKASGGRPALVNDHDVITLEHKGDNPKRAEAARRFNKYKTGMSVLEYIEAVGDRRQGLRDVAWDMKMGWISIAGKAKAPKAKAEPAPEAPASEAPAAPEAANTEASEQAA